MIAGVAAAVWSLDGDLARLTTDGWRGAIDLRRPDRGLGELAHGDAVDTARKSWRLLGVVGEQPRGTELLDVYVRGGDLVATYGPRDDADLRRQIYWRVASAERFPEVVLIDVQVSVQTPLLDSCPATVVESSFTADEVRRLTPAADRWESVVASADGPVEFAASEPRSRSCCLFRLAGATCSYVEMIHPVDFHRDSLNRDAATGRWTLSHGLFVDTLEKGVILRSRVRGAFVPRQRDETLAAEICAAFGAEPPPLTT